MPPIYVTPELYHAIIQLSNQTPPPSQPAPSAPSSSPSTIPPTVPTFHALDLINRLAGSLRPNPEIALEGSLEPNTLRECLTRYVPPRFAVRSRPHSRTQSPSSSSSDSLRTRSGNLLSYIPGPMSVTSTDVRDAVLPLLGTNKIRVRRTAEVGRLIVDEVNRYFPSDTSDASEDEAAGTVPALERSRTGTDATGSADEDVNMNSAETPLMPTDTGIFPQPTPDPLLSPSHALGRWVTYLYHAREIINAASSLRYEVHQTVAKHTTLGKAINDLIDHVWSLHPHPSPTTPNPTAIPANYPLSNAPHPPTVESATPHWVFPKESKSAGVPDWVCYFGDRTVACEEDKREEVMSNESMANIAGKASTGTVMGVVQGGFYIGLEAQGLRIKATYVSGSTLVLPEVEGLVLLQVS